ncbi:hypothetical protein [Planomonospora sp. ID82291]|uniref:hypothetical protein n=1 Tax=Planomonospora sp. ID82291 TaxID=2738136 RepID=UPI0018C399D6|nr:hypothetical protein [Planomonospora sp. ID82291]MBG0818718.1 hypothetical protein [Planomonospora sp. ID82291]
MRDATMSFRARGVLAFLLARPDRAWTADDLVDHGTERRAEIAVALAEVHARPGVALPGDDGTIAVAREAACDTAVSFRARGVLVFLLALLPDPRARLPLLAELADCGTEGQQAVRKALAELKDCGYYAVETGRSPNGAFRSRSHLSATPGERGEW